MNYLIVLFKNKRRKKIINKFVTHDRASKKYEELISKSSEVLFEVIFENGKEVIYEIGLVSANSKQDFPVYKMDELGRTVKVKLEQEGLNLSRVDLYKKEESIYDLEKKSKITIKKFIENYLKSKELKMISVLNNKIILQRDERINVFSLKSENESIRFLNTLSNHFFKNKRTDCLFVRDTSTPQKKYLYNLLVNYGFDKKIFYRKFTTFPEVHRG